MNLTDETDNLMDIMYDTVLVPPNLEETAQQIVKSDRVPFEQSNTVNLNKGRYQVKVWNRLTDTNNWFLLDSKYMKLFLKWFDRIPTEFNKDKDFDTYVSRWSVYTRYSFGFSGWQFIYGHQVS